AVEKVVRVIGGVGVRGHPQHAADAASSLEAAAQVNSPREGEGRDVVAVALLQGQESVVNQADFIGQFPRAVGPVVFAADAHSAQAVIRQSRAPDVGQVEFNRAVFGVEKEVAFAIGQEIAIGVVAARQGGGIVGGD